MANNPPLNRPMFTPVQPTLPLQQMASPGISALPRPDVEAQNLRNLFTPTQPMQSFREGGEVINGVKHFQVGGIKNISQAELARVQDRESRRQFDIDDTENRSRMGSPQTGILPGSFPSLSELPGEFSMTPAGRALRGLYDFGSGIVGARFRGMTGEAAPGQAAPARPSQIAPGDMFTGPGGGEVFSNDPARPVMSQLGERAAPPPSAATREPVKPKGELELSLEAIRSRRSEDRKENALLALMQAGFATAAGQSPNALSNIGAGGQAGIAAFAGMERSSREDQRAAMQDLAMRRREMSAESLAREKMAQDPETVRTYAILGGYTPGQSREEYQKAVSKGLSVSQSKDGPKLAVSILSNPLLTQLYTPEQLKGLADYARQGVIEMGGGGGGARPPEGSTIIPLNQLTRPPAR